MIYKWETDKERLLRFMKISPLKKMEWLREINEFVLKSSTKRSKAIRRKMREMR
jgi:hypothetical protein